MLPSTDVPATLEDPHQAANRELESKAQTTPLYGNPDYHAKPEALFLTRYTMQPIVPEEMPVFIGENQPQQKDLMKDCAIAVNTLLRCIPPGQKKRIADKVYQNLQKDLDPAHMPGFEQIAVGIAEEAMRKSVIARNASIPLLLEHYQDLSGDKQPFVKDGDNGGLLKSEFKDMEFAEYAKLRREKGEDGVRACFNYPVLAEDPDMKAYLQAEGKINSKLALRQPRESDHDMEGVKKPWDAMRTVADYRVARLYQLTRLTGKMDHALAVMDLYANGIKFDEAEMMVISAIEAHDFEEKFCNEPNLMADNWRNTPFADENQKVNMLQSALSQEVAKLNLAQWNGLSEATSDVTSALSNITKLINLVPDGHHLLMQVPASAAKAILSFNEDAFDARGGEGDEPYIPPFFVNLTTMSKAQALNIGHFGWNYDRDKLSLTKAGGEETGKGDKVSFLPEEILALHVVPNTRVKGKDFPPAVGISGEITPVWSPQTETEQKLNWSQRLAALKQRLSEEMGGLAIEEQDEVFDMYTDLADVFITGPQFTDERKAEIIDKLMRNTRHRQGESDIGFDKVRLAEGDLQKGEVYKRGLLYLMNEGILPKNYALALSAERLVDFEEGREEFLNIEENGGVLRPEFRNPAGYFRYVTDGTNDAAFSLSWLTKEGEADRSNIKILTMKVFPKDISQFIFDQGEANLKPENYEAAYNVAREYAAKAFTFEYFTHEPSDSMRCLAYAASGMSFHNAELEVVKDIDTRNKIETAVALSTILSPDRSLSMQITRRMYDGFRKAFPNQTHEVPSEIEDQPPRYMIDLAAIGTDARLPKLGYSVTNNKVQPFTLRIEGVDGNGTLRNFRLDPDNLLQVSVK